MRDIRFQLYILRPRMARAISLSAARLSTKQPRPVHARTGLPFSMYLSVPYIFPCLRRRERQSAIMAINSLFVGLPLMPIKIAYSCSSFDKVLIKILPICSHYSTRKMMPSYFDQSKILETADFVMKSAVSKAITCETEASVHSRKHWKQFKAVYYSGTELRLLTKSRPRELSAACTSPINAIAGVP